MLTDNMLMSHSNYEGANNFSKAQNLLRDENRRLGMGVDFQMIGSPKSFDDETDPDVEKDLNLESLSNGDLSPIDANSMQRSFTHLHFQKAKTTVGKDKILRKTTSENGYPIGDGVILRDLGADFNDQLADVEQFKKKGDTFYQNKKYE